MERPLWELLSEDPSDLTCDQCFAVMEYYAEVLAKSGAHLLPRVLEHLRRCPSCEGQHREALQYGPRTHIYPPLAGASYPCLPDAPQALEPHTPNQSIVAGTHLPGSQVRRASARAQQPQDILPLAYKPRRQVGRLIAG